MPVSLLSFSAAIMAQALELFFGLPIVGRLYHLLDRNHPDRFPWDNVDQPTSAYHPTLWVIMLIASFIFIFWTEPRVFSDWVTFAGRRGNSEGFDVLYFGAATGVLFSLVVQAGETGRLTKVSSGQDCGEPAPLVGSGRFCGTRLGCYRLPENPTMRNAVTATMRMR
jgi:hypothetical protein